MVVDLSEAYEQIDSYWDPHVAGELNGQHVKLARIEGEFDWHHHQESDELFFVHEGELTIQFCEQEDVTLTPGQFHIVPAGVEHRPVAVHLERHVVHPGLPVDRLDPARRVHLQASVRLEQQQVVAASLGYEVFTGVSYHNPDALIGEQMVNGFLIDNRVDYDLLDWGGPGKPENPLAGFEALSYEQRLRVAESAGFSLFELITGENSNSHKIIDYCQNSGWPLYRSDR